jgi:hypothetical protein
LLCASTGAVLDAAIGPYSGKTGSEHALFRELLGSISANDLILADRYYCAYFVIALIQAQGADVLFKPHPRRRNNFRDAGPYRGVAEAKDLSGLDDT